MTAPISPEDSMVRFLARLLGIAIGASIVAGIASSIAALRLKKSAPPRPGRSRRRDRPRCRHGRHVVRQHCPELPRRARHLLVRRHRRRPPRGEARPGRRAPRDPDRLRRHQGGRRPRRRGPDLRPGHLRRGHEAGRRRPTFDTPGLEITGFTVFGGLQVVVAEQGEAIPSWTPERPADTGAARRRRAPAGPADGGAPGAAR